LANGFALVHGTGVPNHDHRFAQMSQEPAEKRRRPSGIYKGPPIEALTLAAGRKGQRGGHRNPFPVGALGLQDVRLALWRQRTSDQRRHQEASFVDQDEVRSLTPRPFFIRGHSSRSHRRISHSLRSRDCRAGFCEVTCRCVNHWLR